ncbi:MAG: sigma-54-dependent Fis family transcriptional regulator, partial [Deltaproteobacteria bacterium]|nr:sigma-54-dependent Fis family transcriptional regulator [Deltaproteobacteria bacterium]
MKNNQGSFPRLLLVEDDGYCRFFLRDILSLPDIEIETAGRDSKIFEKASQHDFDAIMLSFRGIIQNDLSIVQSLHEDNPYAPLIAVAERMDVDFALDVLRAGAFDYLVRPFQNAARVESALKNAFLESDNLRKGADLADTKVVDHGMVGKSRVVLEILKKCRQIAPLNVNVLISGESGTGKELIALAVHAESHRKQGPFLAVNCGAIPDGLIESIFFGHEKGAFTGAVQSHAGIMEKADGGTVFLDEIGELSSKGQVTLLRFMEDREFIKVGGVKTHTSDV